MIRLVNGTPLPTESPVDRQRRERRRELYKQHRYGGEDRDAARALERSDMAAGTYEEHIREWVRMMKAANLFPTRREDYRW